MNGRKAKALRKQIYGDNSFKQERTYVIAGGSRINSGLRGKYQLAKHPESRGTLFQVNR